MANLSHKHEIAILMHRIHHLEEQLQELKSSHSVLTRAIQRRDWRIGQLHEELEEVLLSLEIATNPPSA